MKLKCEVTLEGANHAGEFIRRYSPDACPSVGGGPSVGPAYIVGVDTSLVPTVVGANHAGEFIRRYSPDMTGWRVRRSAAVRRSGRRISSASIHRWYPRS